MTPSYFFYAALALGLLSVIVWGFFDAGRNSSVTDKRIVWIPVVMVIWSIGTYQFASTSSHPCVVENSGRAPRGNVYYDYIDCSGDLLSGSAIDISLFVWTWLPLMVMTVFCVRYLIDFARKRIRGDRKKS